MQDLAAMPYLIASLENVEELPIVRHEAAEALGALSDPSALPFLEKYLNDPERVVRETCELAVAKIQHDIKVKQGCGKCRGRVCMGVGTGTIVG